MSIHRPTLRADVAARAFYLECCCAMRTVDRCANEFIEIAWRQGDIDLAVDGHSVQISVQTSDSDHRSLLDDKHYRPTACWVASIARNALTLVIWYPNR